MKNQKNASCNFQIVFLCDRVSHFMINTITKKEKTIMKSNKFLTIGLSALLSASLVLTTLLTVWSETKGVAKESIDAWDGTVAESFAGGTGIFVDPYLIENAEQFAKAILNIEEPGKYYKLTNDIYLNDASVDNWTDNTNRFGRIFTLST